MKFIKKYQSLFFIASFFCLAIIPTVIFATDSSTVRNLQYLLEAPIGTITKIDNLVQYILLLYNIAVSAAGIIAVVVIMFGGFMWAVSAGNEQRITSAKETIVSAVIGLILVLGSYVIFNFINPQLLNLDFVIPEIELFVPDNQDLYSLPPCSEARFNSLCANTACGSACMTQGEICHGVVCEPDATYKIGCAPLIVEGSNTMQCMIDSCAKYAEQVFKKYGKDSAQYSQQLCSYYPSLIKKISLGVTDFYKNHIDANPTALYYLTNTCNETMTVLEWEDYFKSNSPTFYQWATTNSASFNCGFKCKLQESISFPTSVYNCTAYQ